VLQVLSANVNLYKDFPAVMYQGHTTTYGELDVAADNIANNLFFDHQLAKGSLVVILLDRSEKFMAAVIGIWKCGAAYVPVDPAYPGHRINIIIESAAPALIISNDTLISRFNLTDTGIPVVNIDAVAEYHNKLNVAVGPSDLAYVIFTSGSTGRPKGVMIEHAGMLNHLYAKINDLSLSADAVVCQNASQSFDISVWQFFSALLTGGRTVIYSNDEILDPDGFITGIIHEKINILELVPSYLSVLLDTGKNRNMRLKYLMVTGETLKPQLVEKWFEQYPHIPMVNAYGPTEASDDITHHVMHTAPLSKNIPIGRPVQNMHIYILDNHMQLCPVGIPGEIYVAGIGVGRGYLNDPAKTAAFFSTDPFRSDEAIRMYRTGDVGKFLEDGSIEFYGRKDHQVKIRGNRVELEEVENTILNHPDVKEAIVLVKEGADSMLLLVAYIVAVTAPEESGLREYLSRQLPDYMVPSFIIQIENMPLTANGKIDRKALPELDLSQRHQYVPPGNYMEEQLVTVWEDVLGRNDIGIKDNFFGLGGHSLGVVRILNAVQMEFNVKVDIRELFENPTIEQLSQEISLLMALQEPDVTTGDNNKEIII
jgi:amino acid adenylation domain-containing protein